MPEYREIQKTTTLPKGIGIDGYLAALRAILTRPRVQEVTLAVGGEVTYRRFALLDEPEDELGLELETLMPYGVVRSRPIEELVDQSGTAATVVGRMFAAVVQDGLNAVAFVGGASSQFFWWYHQDTGIRLVRDEIYGLPFLQDAEIPDDVLLLCGAYSRTASLSDTKKSYKITVPIQRGHHA